MLDDEELNTNEDVDPRIKDAEERIAKKLGWKPLEEWDRDPKDHESASAFLERTPRELQKMREERKRLARTTETMIEEVRLREREIAEREIREAMARNDTEGVISATRKAAQGGPDPLAVEWAKRNSWYYADEEAQAYANIVAAREARKGVSGKEQLERVEDAVRKRFPEHFDYSDNDYDEVEEKPRRETSRAPVVQSGNRISTPPVKSQDEDWRSLPRASKEALEGFVEILMHQSSISEKEARERIAKRHYSLQKSGDRK